MKILLGVLAVALAAVLALQWADWPPQGVPLGAEQPDDPTLATLPSAGQPVPADLLDPPASKDEYAEVYERPLFTPDRRPPEEEPEPEIATAEEEIELDRLVLNATLLLPERSLAWVQELGAQELKKIEPEDDLEGWTVAEIARDKVVLERQGEQHTLLLRDYENLPPAAPARPRPTAAAGSRGRTPAVNRRVRPPRAGTMDPRSRLRAQRPESRDER